MGCRIPLITGTLPCFAIVNSGDASITCDFFKFISGPCLPFLPLAEEYQQQKNNGG